MPRPARLDALLDSASRLFSASGFAATSVRQVAAAADLTKAGLYYHVRDKEDLLFRICEGSISTILERARTAMAEGGDPGRRIAALIGVHTDFFFAHPSNLGVLNRDMGALSPGRRADIARLERAYLDLIRGVIGEGQAAGLFRPVDVGVAAFTLLSVLNHLDVWYRREGAVGPAEVVRQITDLVLGGLLADAPAPAQGASP